MEEETKKLSEEKIKPEKKGRKIAQENSETKNISPEEDLLKRHPENPMIIGGICEFCGYHVSNCPKFKKLYQRGEIKCFCPYGHLYKSRFLYVDKLRGFLCDSAGCMAVAEKNGLKVDPKYQDLYLKLYLTYLGSVS